MNPLFKLALAFVGPTQIGGWVRAAVASGVTYFGTKYGLGGILSPETAAEVGAIASTLVVGTWSSISKSGKVYAPDILTSVTDQVAIDRQAPAS